MDVLNCLECGNEMEVMAEDGFLLKGESYVCEKCGLIHKVDSDKLEILNGKLIHNSRLALRYDYATRDVSIPMKR